MDTPRLGLSVFEGAGRGRGKLIWMKEMGSGRSDGKWEDRFQSKLLVGSWGYG